MTQKLFLWSFLFLTPAAWSAATFNTHVITQYSCPVDAPESIRNLTCQAKSSVHISPFSPDQTGIRAGLCVVVGCGLKNSSGSIAKLASNSKLLVHGICFDKESEARAWKAIKAKRVIGQAFVERMNGPRLPYATEMCNLVVVEDMALLKSHKISKKELLRITAPNGILYVKNGNTWKTMIKPRNPEYDEWPQLRHGADGNVVSTDKGITFPLELRWIAGTPKNMAHHAGVKAVVYGGGRSFAITPNVRLADPAAKKQYYLVSRDAMNGLLYWRIPLYQSRLSEQWSWAATIPLAVEGQNVYAGTTKSILVVDAKTGEKRFSCDTTQTPVRMLVHHGVMVASCWNTRTSGGNRHLKFRNYLNTEKRPGTIEAFDAKTGRKRWTLPFMSRFMFSAKGKLYVIKRPSAKPKEAGKNAELKKLEKLEKPDVMAVDIATGKILWSVPCGKSAMLLLAGDGFVVTVDSGENKIIVLSAKSGKTLYKIALKPRRRSSPPTLVAVVDGLLLAGDKKYDPLSGKVKGSLGVDLARYGRGCQKALIAGDYVLGRDPLLYSLYKKGSRGGGVGARGACVQGTVPANRMLYTASNYCVCNPGQVLGYLAFGPARTKTAGATPANVPTERGPGFGKVSFAKPNDGDWFTFRGNHERNRTIASDISTKLTVRWRSKINAQENLAMEPAWLNHCAPKLTSPIVAASKVFVATKHSGNVYCLDAASGKSLWDVTLPSRVSTPSVYGNTCLVGCHDGWLYAFLADTGELAWRTRIAPREQRIVANGCIESRWPVLANAMWHDGVLWVTAGRSTGCDGGVTVRKLDPRTGKSLWSRNLVTSDQTNYQRSRHRDNKRNDAMYTTKGKAAWNNRRLDSLDKLISDPTFRKVGWLVDGHLGEFRFRGYSNKLAAQEGQLTVRADGNRCVAKKCDLKFWSRKWQGAPGGVWTHTLSQKDLVINNVVMTKNHVVLGVKNKKKMQGLIVVLNRKDGTPAGELSLASPPVYNGISVASGAIYASLENGETICIGPKK